MFFYAVLSHDEYFGLRLVSSHLGGSDAWAAYRRARPPCLLVRLGPRDVVVVLEAKGVDLGEQTADLRRAVRRAVNTTPARR